MGLTSYFSIEDIRQLLNSKIEIDANAAENINRCRLFLDNKIEEGKIYYGINTGFGSLCNVAIAKVDLEALQVNLVRSHACGLGNRVPLEIVKLMLLLKIKNFSYGHSGVSLALCELLCTFFNENLLPEVFEQGSLGASGDLAPLAHLSLPLIGEGKLFFENEWQESEAVLKKNNIPSLQLKSKEGLALLNGTQFMCAYAAWALMQMQEILSHSTKIAALSFEAYNCTAQPFSPNIHNIRPHDGQVKVATAFNALLHGSKKAFEKKEQVQDPYSFRCIPQVHGASYDVYAYAKKVVETELNSVTDNPLIFPEEDQILSGGNFHGQPLALQLDFLAIALSELANISERRIYLLMNGQRGLPPYLSKNPGIESGFMIAQYAAAAVVSQNKQLCSPASVDSIVSSNGQEDHVSMGANAATKLYQIVLNVQKVLAIELLCAAQAMDFKNVEDLSPTLKSYYSSFREQVHFMPQDRVIHEDITKAIAYLFPKN